LSVAEVKVGRIAENFDVSRITMFTTAVRHVAFSTVEVVLAWNDVSVVVGAACVQWIEVDIGSSSDGVDQLNIGRVEVPIRVATAATVQLIQDFQIEHCQWAARPTFCDTRLLGLEAAIVTFSFVVLDTHVVVHLMKSAIEVWSIEAMRVTDGCVETDPGVSVATSLLVSHAKSVSQFMNHRTRIHTGTAELGKLCSGVHANVCHATDSWIVENVHP